MEIIAQDICEQFNLRLFGNEKHRVSSISSLENQDEASLMWAKSPHFLSKVKKGVVICSQSDYENNTTKINAVTYLVTTESPRLTFSKVVQRYVGTSAIVLKNEVDLFKSRTDIIISENCFIGPNVEIGKGTILYPNVVIHAGTKIGENCVIKSFCSIGSEGLGFEKVDNQLIKFPQLGGVIMGNNVEIGPNSTIRRAAIDNTIVKDGCKIGSFVNIGHNCIIGENSILTCQIVTAGGSIIGKNVFMGVNSSVKQKVTVGNDATIGQGAVIVKNVNDHETVVGNPGKVIGNTPS